MKKSVEIIGLPVISITEGRELGMSKSLLIDAPNGSVAAITIEDEDWYRGVKLLPYSSVIAIGEDAVTITNSENILTLEDAGDYEAMMDTNIKIIGTKAITKSGTIQGKVVEIYIGDNGKIEKCEIEGRDGSLSEIVSDQISIFGKQVTVIDSDFEKKTEIIAPVETPAVAAPKTEAPKVEIKEAPKAVDAAAQMADKATEERHRRFLLGKTVTKDIVSATGVVLAKTGDVVTEEILQKVKMANMFIDLSMNVK